MVLQAQSRFLPDRYIEGTCYICGYTNAAAINAITAEACWRHPADRPALQIDGSSPSCVRPSTFFSIRQLQQYPRLLRQRAGYWRPNVLRQSWADPGEDLHGRAITRDLDWASRSRRWLARQMPVCLFEAVIGYLSASVEWLHSRHTDAWNDCGTYSRRAATTYRQG